MTWKRNDVRNDAGQSLESALADQRGRWERGERVPAENYLSQCPSWASDPEAVLDLIGNELLLRMELGEHPLLSEFEQRFPQWSAQLKLQFEVELAIEAEARQAEVHG